MTLEEQLELRIAALAGEADAAVDVVRLAINALLELAAGAIDVRQPALATMALDRAIECLRLAEALIPPGVVPPD